jgi:ppGpp synthetase/RelA/SpoT-type nucleotidyltranferase
LEEFLSLKAVFEGLVYDEYGNPVETGFIGSEPCYIVDDDGFKRHISAEEVDQQVWAYFQAQIEGKEDLLSEKAAEMLGQDDIFTMAAIQNQLKNLDSHYEKLAEIGIPEESRMYLGMIGFRIIISIHGEVLEVVQPGIVDESDDE